MKLEFRPNVLLPIDKKIASVVQPVVCGREVCKPGHHYSRPLDYHLIHYIENGKGILIKNGKTYHLNKGQCFIICPRETYMYQADTENPWTYMWIGFTGDITQKLDQLESPVFNSSPKYFIEMLNCVNFNDMSVEYLTAKVLEFMCHEFCQRKNGNYADIAKNLVDISDGNQLSVMEIAKYIGIDKRYLSRIFKLKYSITLKDYIIQKKMSDAQFYLKSGYSVSEVSKLVGYSDEFAFSRAFKKEFNYPPSKIKLKKISE